MECPALLYIYKAAMYERFTLLYRLRSITRDQFARLYVVRENLNDYLTST